MAEMHHKTTCANISKQSKVDICQMNRYVDIRLYVCFCIMFFHVTLQMIRLCVRKVAVLTRKGLFPTVGKHVQLQASSCCAGVVALLATERLLS